MTDHAQSQMLFHGTVILLAGLLTGIPLAIALANGAGPDTIHAWRVTHSSLTSGAIALIAIGAAARHLLLAARAAAVLVWTLVGSTYALSGGLIVTALTGLRGLDATGPAPNVALHLVNVAGVLGALVAALLLLRGAGAGLRAARAARRRERGVDVAPVPARTTA